jgi:predicted neuraminidase
LLLRTNISNFTNLFTDSQSSGKLTNFTITDFGSQLKKARLSFGNVNLGIYKQGSRKKPAPLFHDQQSEQEIYQLVANLKSKSHYYASLRNFKNSIIMNFTAEDFARGLYFST